ncbi:response regulator transcription factor [Aquimarina sediminis]|uniref:response regulator transcription factor n=1 Tax=Aquimarina sediminis TaxID=2070536 RepID=UPI000CA022E6|nr:response regulator transcription factor [Aquimarina sediminis]
MQHKVYLPIFIFFLFNISCYSQYSISGYINSKEKNKVVYLSLLRYDEENLISTEQVLFSVKTDSTGYFEMNGKLLSDKNKLYRIHSNLKESNTGFQLFDNGINKNYHNFIFSNTDTIYFPNNNKVWFSNSKNSNSADKLWRKSLKYESKLLKEYIETRNTEAILQAKKSFSKEFKSYCTDSLSDPLVKLLAFSHIKKNIIDLEEDFKKDSNFYYNIQNQLNQYYTGTSYHLQYHEKISVLSLSAIKQNYIYHKNINYFLSTVVLILSVIIFFMFQRVKTKRKQEIVYEVSSLTSQEEKVAKLICKGMSNKEIASSLFISLSTVKTHIRNLYSKLEISNRQELVKKLKKHPPD